MSHHEEKERDTKGTSDKTEEPVKHHTGYEPKELLKAPLKPPEPSETPPPTTPQKYVIGLGIAVAVVGLFLWPGLGPFASITLTAIGVGVLLWGVAVRMEG